jgi:hypothetical protein
MDRLVIAPDVHPAYFDGRLDRAAARYVLALVVLAVSSDPGQDLKCPHPGRVRLVAGLSRRRAAGVLAQLREVGALTRATTGKDTTTTLHAPGYLICNDSGRGLAAYGLPALRGQRGALWVMRALLDVTPYGRSAVTVRLAELARRTGYTPRWTRSVLDQLATLGWLTWETGPDGLATITLRLAPGALALIAYPFDLHTGNPWASRQ